MKRLLLAVIDGCKPSMLERAVERGEAPAIAAVLERGAVRARAVRRVPVGDAGLRDLDRDRRAAGPPPHRGDELVVARRAPLRRVRLVVPRRAQARHRQAADRHGVQPQRQPPGARRRDDLRVARRRRRADGGHDLPRLPRPPRAPRLARDRADAAGRPLFRKPVHGPARALLRRHLRQPRDGLPQRRWACRAIRDQHSGCVGAWLAARDLYDFLLLSLPDNDTHSHKNGPHAQPTSIAAADAADPARRRGGRRPGRASSTPTR